ncbi:unnamed protein product [Lactuca virosa]|uniref:Transposase-associated domain-containing protein n=1 Tax=Lactuca virosa TaxID=75947 RepID=A0AAU9PD95_9ASTR|nr:unnamed protein product [Lactuca virosa]
MNASKVEEDLFHHHLDSIGDPQPLILDHHDSIGDPQPSILDHHDHQEEQQPPSEFSLPPMSEFDFFRDDDEDDSISHTSSDAEGVPSFTNDAISSDKTNPRFQYINPEPHISSQFYTFNIESHSLMIRCILEGRLATPDEIRLATPLAVLTSWRSVWKDRNEDTAYLTAWKRIQEKLTVHVGEQGLKETIERIKQVWTVGAKFYGIPESYIRVCVAACPVCLDSSGSAAARSKRRRFEYTESFDVPAKEVPNKLQQLAAKHKVVLCIRQKYIRYKPFMAEVKDYACHRAGEPASSSKKSRNLKREAYASKRCGCRFRIRAIVPISNYNEKDKTFVYEEEGIAVFKLYAVHSGHEPGPLDGNARIMHRIVGHKGGLLMEQDMVFGMSEEESFSFMGKDDGDMQRSVLQQVKELRNEVGLLEGKMTKIPPELLGSVSQELFDLLNKVRSVGGYEESKSGGGDLVCEKLQSDDDHVLVGVGENDLGDWSHHQRIYGDGKDAADLIEDDDDSFGQTLGDVASCSWDEKDLLCKPEKWLKCSSSCFDEKAIILSDSKLIKPNMNMNMETDSLVSLQVDSFYPENPSKWYE